MLFNIKVELAATTLIMMMAFFSIALMSYPVGAQTTNPQQEICEQAGGEYSEGTCSGGPGETDLFGSNGLFTTIANILIFLTGAISVIVLIIGGFRFVVSGGDSQAVQGARNQILYAIVGIVVAIMAYAVVRFIVDRL